MSIKTVLFDLDGTLLPMDQDEFVQVYFGGLCRRLAPLGYKAKQLTDSIWKGTAAMVKNNGSTTNEQVFWNTMTDIYGKDILDDIPVFDDFYRNEFSAVKTICGFNPKAKTAVDLIKANGCRVALATNPIFPAVATESRIRWAGLEPSDFEYFTTYENSRHCKPNPEYYKDITEALGLNAEECLMVGNDVDEDMIAARLGMKVFLLTDCLINKNGRDLSGYPAGNFDALIKFIEENI